MINMENKTDKEKLLEILNLFEPPYDKHSLEYILDAYIEHFAEDFSALRLHGMITELEDYLRIKLEKLDKARFVANERATYLKKYLDGSMWKDEKLAKEYVQPQIENAQAIIDACKVK